MRDMPFENNSRSSREPEEETDLFAYLAPILERKWAVLGIFLLVLAATGLVLVSIQPSYQSTTTLLIAEPHDVVGIRDDTQPEARGAGYLHAQVEILRSRSLAEQVIERLELYKEPEFMPDSASDGSTTWPDWLPAAWLPANWPLPDQLRDWLMPLLGAGADRALSAQGDSGNPMTELLNSFSNRLIVEPAPSAQLVRISFEARDPELAARVANAVVAVYMESNREARQAANRQTADDLRAQLDDLRTQLDSSEQALQAFRESEGIVETGGTTLAQTRINILNQQILDAQRRVTEAEFNYRQVARLREESPQYLFSLAFVQQDTLLQSLLLDRVELEAELARYRKLVGERHPRIVTLVTDLESARRAIDERLASIIDNMERQFESAQSNLDELRQVMRDAEGEIQGVNRASFEYERLQRGVETNRRLYDLFLTRLREMEVAFQTANARVVDDAAVPVEPFKPDKPKLLLLGTFAGVFMGIGWAFFREFTNTKPRHIQDIETKLDVPVLGFLPLVKLRGRKKNRESAALYYRDKPGSPFAEAIRTLQMGVIFSSPDYPRKIIVVTSSVPGEGKSTVAMNLALALGRASDVLLIDADLRQPTLGVACGLEQSAAGLSQYVIGKEELNACLHPVQDTRVLLMPSGVIPPNPIELLSSRKFSTLLDRQQQRFQHVVIDSPPVLAVSDWMALAKLANEMVVVVKANSSPYKMIRTTIRQLQKVKAPLTGLVLNQVKTKHLPGYGYGYGYGGEQHSPHSFRAKAA